jgi:hypothetical protein
LQLFVSLFAIVMTNERQELVAQGLVEFDTKKLNKGTLAADRLAFALSQQSVLTPSCAPQPSGQM